ncbi:hypothetical protein H5410_047508, partial [Solanum commersonii]
ESTLPLVFVVDNQHLSFVFHANPLSQLLEIHNPVEQWIPEVILVEASSLVVELTTL